MGSRTSFSVTQQLRPKLFANECSQSSHIYLSEKWIRNTRNKKWIAKVTYPFAISTTFRVWSENGDSNLQEKLLLCLVMLCGPTPPVSWLVLKGEEREYHHYYDSIFQGPHFIYFTELMHTWQLCIFQVCKCICTVQSWFSDTFCLCKNCR